MHADHRGENAKWLCARDGGNQQNRKEVDEGFHLMPNAQDLRCAAGWRAGCSAVGMPAKAIRSGHWLALFFLLLIVDLTTKRVVQCRKATMKCTSIE
jgi:hypothetical protein